MKSFAVKTLTVAALQVLVYSSSASAVETTNDGAITRTGSTAETATSNLATVTASSIHHNIGSGHYATLISSAAATSFTAGEGMRVFRETVRTPGRWALFIAGNGGHTRYTNLNVDDGSGLLGLGRSWGLSKGTLSLGVFGELGTGSYTSAHTHTNTSGTHQLRSHGDNAFAGVGLMSRFLWNNNLYLEATARTGRSAFNYNSRITINNQPVAVTHSEEMGYTGFSFGGGVENTYANGLRTDAYLKYLYNRVDGINLTLDGHDFRFGETTTQAGLVGLQFSRSFGSLTPYGAVEVERVVRANSRHTINGLILADLENLEGDTLIGKLGLRYAPGNTWSADVGVSGFSGQRDGYNANLAVAYKF